MQSFTIERLTTADQSAVAALLVAQMLEHRIEAPGDAMEGAIAELITNKQFGDLFVAKVSGEVVGVAFLAVMMSMEHYGYLGWLEELYVAPAHRERGIGQALLDKVMEAARHRKLAAVELEVDIDHRRVESLYRRNGFQTLPRSRWVRKLTS